MLMTPQQQSSQLMLELNEQLSLDGEIALSQPDYWALKILHHYIIEVDLIEQQRLSFSLVIPTDVEGKFDPALYEMALIFNQLDRDKQGIHLALNETASQFVLYGQLFLEQITSQQLYDFVLHLIHVAQQWQQIPKAKFQSSLQYRVPQIQ